MSAPGMKLTTEIDLKELMADLTRAMEKANQAVARVTTKPAPASAESVVDSGRSRSRWASRAPRTCTGTAREKTGRIAIIA